ncbi:MAG: hypothetical protein JKY92_03725 [Magnetovibrio sp.]|nr:hypothetical protein [Magnetovibrio sp.]
MQRLLLQNLWQTSPETLTLHRQLSRNAFQYLAKHGTPQIPQDLKQHDCIIIREIENIRINPVLSTNEREVARNWALDGQGILLRSQWDVAETLKSGALVQVLKDYSLADAGVVALLGHQHGRTARTTAFLKLLSQELSPPPWSALA